MDATLAFLLASPLTSALHPQENQSIRSYQRSSSSEPSSSNLVEITIPAVLPLQR